MRPATFTWLAVVIAVCCAAIEWLGIAGWIAAAVLVASVAMHVIGTALGTSLREATDRDLRRVRAVAAAAEPLPRPRAHRLEQRTSLGRLVPVSAGIGAACGGSAGATALVAWTSCTTAGAVLGGASAAVIGGLAGFLAASFVEILRVSLRESLAAERGQAIVDR
jgi:hypothetical protein